MENDGSSTLYLTSINLPNGFSLVGGFDSSVGPNDYTTFTVQLDAETSGFYSGEIVINNNDSDEAPFNIDISGTVNDIPEIEVYDTETGSQISDGGSFDFGTVTIGETASRTFRVKNTGLADLTLESLTLDNGYFSVGGFGQTMLAPDESTTFTVTFNAPSVDSFTGALSFGNNDNDESPFNISLSGVVKGYEATIDASSTPTEPADRTNADPDRCNCTCGCDTGTIKDVKLDLTNPENPVLKVKINIPPEVSVSDSLILEGSIANKKISPIYINIEDRDENGDLFVSVGIDFDDLTGAWQESYSLSISSENRFLEGDTKTTSGKVDVPLAGVAITNLAQLYVDGNDALVRMGGDVLRFIGTGGGTFSLMSSGSSSYTSEAGDFSTLEETTSGYKMTSKWGHSFEFASDGTLSKRTQADGSVTDYSYTTVNGTKLLTSMVGNDDTMTFTYTGTLLTGLSNTKGWVMSMTYDANDRLETITRADPDGAGPLSAPVKSYTYDANGRVATITEPGGLVTSYTYDSTGRVASITAPDGSVTTYVSAEQSIIDGGNALETVTDSNGITTQYEYDDLGNVIREIDGEGNETIYERDANGLVTKITLPDPDGAGPLESPVYEYTYDARGNMLTETLPDASVRTWVYHSTWNEPVQFTDANGNVTLYTYDSTHQWLLSETQVIGEIDDAVNQETDDLTTTYTYTAAPTTTGDPPIGLVASMTAPDGVVTEYEYDEDGNRTKITYAVGTVDEAFTTSTYDAAGNMLTFTDELGNTTTYTYDNLSRVTSITYADPDGAGPLTSTVETYTYNAMGFVATESINGRTTTYTYDSQGRLEKITEADPDDTGPLTAPETSYTYDSNGNVLTITDPLGNVTTYGYTDGLLTSITEPDPDGAGPQSSPVTSYTYDNIGRILTVTDPLGQVTTYTYDNLGREISVTLADPDGTGPLASLSSSTVYDTLGRIVSETDFQGINTTYTYDSESNLLTETTPLGTTTYAYDELNRLVEVNTADPDGAGALAALVTTYSYTASGQLASVTTPKGTTTYTYDNRRRRTSVILPDPDGAGGQSAPVSSTTYDDAGNVLTETDALGNVTTYEYDALHRVIKITSPDPDGAGAQTSPVTEYGYDEFGQLVSMTDPNGGVTTYEYDNLGRQTKIIYADPDGAGTQTSPEVSYAYDANGQLTSMTDELGNVTTYEYDNLGRQISVTLPDPDGAGSAASPVYTYEYDANGQLLSETDPLGRTTSYTYDAMGRLLTETLPDPDDAGPLSAPVTTYTYDNSGQLASVTDAESQTVSYTYNAAGLVATMTDPGGTTTYTYDALGRQVSIVEPDPDGSGPLSAPTTAYTYDNEGDLVSLTTLDGPTTYEYDDLGRLLKVTQPDPDGAGPEVSPWTTFTYDLLGRTLSESNRLNHTTSYAYDNLGRLIKKTDAEGGETDYAYDANGNLLTLTDPVDNTTTWSYDALNRMLTDTNELNDTRTYQYDAAGNVIEYTDRNSRVTVYEYDNLHRRTAEKWMDGVNLVRTLSYGYDAASQLVSASDPAATYTFTYDNLGRNTSTEHDLAALGFDVVIDEAYDALGRRIGLLAEIDGVKDLHNEYSYDYLDRIIQVTQHGQSGGNVVSEKKVQFGYDDRYRLSEIFRSEDLLSTDPMLVTAYEYDFAGRIKNIEHQGTTAVEPPEPQIPGFGDDGPSGGNSSQSGGNPEIVIVSISSGTEIQDNTGTIDFGNTPATLEKTRSFRITNTGDGDLNISSLGLPAGYSLESSVATVLASGESTILTVALVGTSAGTYSGQISINSDDADESAFEINITGVVQQVNTIVVNSTRDLGDNSIGNGTAWTGYNNSAGQPEVTLRAAIQEANARPGIDRIIFDIPSSDANYAGGVPDIIVGSALPVITGQILIDGWSQSAGGDTPSIRIVSSVSYAYQGLQLQASDSLIRGLIVNGFSPAGLTITGSNNRIEGNIFGLDENGNIHRNHRGIHVGTGASGNIIGTNGDGINDDLEGNVISGGREEGIWLYNAGGGNRIAGNLIGTNFDGTLARANYAHGVHVLNSPNTIIGTNGDGIGDDVEGNVISGNQFSGIAVNNSNSSIIAGNIIGLNADGSAAIRNANHGLYVNNSSGVLVGTNGDSVSDLLERNIISGNLFDGVSFPSSASQNNTLAGNYIGVSKNGQSAIPNSHNGVSIRSARGIIVGTNGDGSGDLAERNVVSGNGRSQILVIGAAASSNRIAGNFIGTTASGDVALPNGTLGAGIRLDGATNTIIGTNGDGNGDDVEGNLISGNYGWAIMIGPNTSVSPQIPSASNTVAGNWIGLSTGGTYLPNSAGGIRISGNSANNRVGSNGDSVSDEYEGNIIAGHNGVGISVGHAGTINNRISRNLLFDNTMQAIDLNHDGVTPNDTGDGDGGPNRLQNKPIITGWSNNIVSGTLNSAANATFKIEIYGSVDLGAGGTANAEVYLGTVTVTTNGSGNAAFNLDVGTGNFNYFSALTISGTGNTSELSAPYAHMGYTPPSGTGTIDRYTYSYDAAGRLVVIDRLNSDSATFEHDDTDQLTGADWDGTTPDENYSYDENGNRTNTGYSTGDNNRLLTDGTYNYTYDAEGNRTRRTSIADGSYTDYDWDYHNRLVGVTDFDVADTMLQKVSYTYDIFGRLIGRELDANGDTVVDESGTFIYDGDQILLVLDETGDVDHRLLWGAAVDQILADENSSGDVNWMLTDHQNTVRDIVQYDEATYTTSVVNHLAYDAFGNVTTETDPSLDVFNLQYTARYFDEATGLQYNNARWYDAATGQWMSQDPISFAAGDENLYRYVGNGTTTWTDPSGLERSVVLPDGSIFKAQGTGHHRVPWSVFSDEAFKFSREVMEVFDGGGRNALINGSWYNFHDGLSMGDFSHDAYNELVMDELSNFKRRSRKFGPEQAQNFLNHLDKLNCKHPIRIFNAGVTAERDLAKEIGDVLYEKYKEDAWFWERDKTLKNRVLDEVGGYVRELRASSLPKEKFLKNLLADISSKVPGKQLAGAAAKKLASAVFVWAVVDQITADGKVHASEIPNAVAMNSPIIGDSIQGGMALGHFYDYLENQLEESDGTGHDWIRRSDPYEPAEERCRPINMHGIDLDL